MYISKPLFLSCRRRIEEIILISWEIRSELRRCWRRRRWVMHCPWLPWTTSPSSANPSSPLSFSSRMCSASSPSEGPAPSVLTAHGACACSAIFCRFIYSILIPSLVNLQVVQLRRWDSLDTVGELEWFACEGRDQSQGQPYLLPGTQLGARDRTN